MPLPARVQPTPDQRRGIKTVAENHGFDVEEMTNNRLLFRDYLDQLAIDAAISAGKEAANTSYRGRKTQECSFPVCEPGRFYCDAESLPGKSYCATHHAVTHRGKRRS